MAPASPVFSSKGGVIGRVNEDYSRQAPRREAGYEFVLHSHITQVRLVRNSGQSFLVTPEMRNVSRLCAWTKSRTLR